MTGGQFAACAVFYVVVYAMAYYRGLQRGTELAAVSVLKKGK